MGLKIAFIFFSFLDKLYFRIMKPDASSEVFTAVKFQVEVFCVVTPCSVVVGYQG